MCSQFFCCFHMCSCVVCVFLWFSCVIMSGVFFPHFHFPESWSRTWKKSLKHANQIVAGAWDVEYCKKTISMIYDWLLCLIDNWWYFQWWLMLFMFLFDYWLLMILDGLTELRFLVGHLFRYGDKTPWLVVDEHEDQRITCLMLSWIAQIILKDQVGVPYYL